MTNFQFLKMVKISVFLVLVLSLAACSSKDKEKLIIADQFGLAYAPIAVMKSKGFLEKRLEENGRELLEVEWKTLGNTSSIRETMLAGELDIAFVGIPPFLIGLDNAMDWKIISGLSESAVALITSDTALENISDITADHRIITPQPGSIQHILLSMAAEKELGDAKAFDNQLLSMSHPDGVTAMLSGGKEYLHFTTPPYLQKELEDDRFKILKSGVDCFGSSFTFNIGVCQERIYEDKPVYEAFKAALKDSIDFMNTDFEGTLEILKSAYEYEDEELRSYLAEDQMNYTMDVNGLEEFVDFMVRNAFISAEPRPGSLYWDGSDIN